MIEREAIYPLITYVGNAVEYDEPAPYLSLKAGGNNDTFIAKMQYAICKQAGIIIVDEFIEDVAVIEIEVE